MWYHHAKKWSWNLNLILYTQINLNSKCIKDLNIRCKTLKEGEYGWCTFYTSVNMEHWNLFKSPQEG
jgi:hypothetical protein